MGMQPIGSNKTVIAEVWGYWGAKRQRLKKPLLRRFWPVPSINDTNAHVVFRPREKERCVGVFGLGLWGVMMCWMPACRRRLACIHPLCTNDTAPLPRPPPKKSAYMYT